MSECTKHLQSILLDDLNQLDKPLECSGFEVGDFVRSVFSNDGRLYDATVTECMDNGRLYRVQFDGYQNEQNVGMYSVLRR